MSESKLKKGEIVTLLTSYCGDIRTGCTDRLPCHECLKMCNTFELQGESMATYTGKAGDTKATTNKGE